MSSKFIEKEEWDTAISVCLEGLKILPNSHIILSSLATAQFLKEDLENAIANYQKAIEIESNQPSWVYQNLGEAFEKNGQLEEALACYTIIFNDLV